MSSAIKLVRKNATDFEEFGPIAFETRKGASLPQGGYGKSATIAVLNRDQALLLIAYMRNNERVRALKKALVKAFSEMERRLQRYEPELTAEQLMAKALPCSKPYLTIRLKPVIMVVSFYKDLNQALSTRDKLGQCIDPRSRSRRPRGFA